MYVVLLTKIFTTKREVFTAQSFGNIRALFCRPVNDGFLGRDASVRGSSLLPTSGFYVRGSSVIDLTSTQISLKSGMRTV